MTQSKTAGAALLLLVLAFCRAEVADDVHAAENDAAVDALVENAVNAVLQQVLTTLTHPTSIREHMKSALSEETRPEVLASAAGCDIALTRWVVGLYHREKWALQMVDASSKLVTGVLYGNFADLGNYDECVASVLPTSAPDPQTTQPNDGFTGRYALPALQVQVAVNASAGLHTGSRLYKALVGAGGRPVMDGANDTEYKTLLSLNMAVCVPSTCRAPLLEAALNHVLKEVNPTLAKAGFNLHGVLPEDYTSVAGPYRPTELADWLVLTFIIVVVFLVCVATAMDVALGSKAKEHRERLGVLLAFSAYTNGRRLLYVAPPSDTNFTCINGMRLLSALWVILGHRYRWALDIPYSNLKIIPERASDISAMTIASAPLSVDTFFLIGGLVNCYSFMKAVQNRRSFNFIMYYVHRYIRLTPAFAMMVAFSATWLSLLNNGPLWAKVAGAAADTCRRNWWTGLLYVANYANPGDQCMMQSWYLMVDMQLHWLSPLILVPLWKFRRIGLAWIVVVLLVSCAVPFGVTYVNHFRAPVSVELGHEAQSFFMRNMYFPTHTRFTSYVFGTLAGFFLYLVKAGEIKRGISRSELTIGWLLSTIICLTVVFGAQPLFDPAHHPYNVWESSFYLGFYKLAWSVGLTWVILACIFGHGGPVNAFLSWTPFSILGRLTYGIYLTHAAIQIADVASARNADYYSDFRMVERMLSDAVLASIFGLFLCLTMESPIMAIEKSLRTRGRKPKSPETITNGATRKTTLNGSAVKGVENSGFVDDEGKLTIVDKSTTAPTQLSLEITHETSTDVVPETLTDTIIQAESTTTSSSPNTAADEALTTPSAPATCVESDGPSSSTSLYPTLPAAPNNMLTPAVDDSAPTTPTDLPPV